MSRTLLCVPMTAPTVEGMLAALHADGQLDEEVLDLGGECPAKACGSAVRSADAAVALGTSGPAAYLDGAALIVAARAAGKRVITGAEVIALQAAEQFERYTGVRPSAEQVAEASAFSRA